MNRRRTFTILAVAAAIAVAVGTIALLTRDDKKTQQVNVATDSDNSTASTTPAKVIAAASPAIWPFEAMNRTFTNPEDAAKSFAVDYLGMTHARVVGSGGNEAMAEVAIVPNDRASARTNVQLENRGEQGWVVVGAKADQIEVDTPTPHTALTLPLSLAGRSVAFEAQIGVELRTFGSMTPFAQSFVMGGGTDMQPFQGQIDAPGVSLASDKAVLILFEGDASGEQTYTKATVIPLDGPLPPSSFVGTTATGEVMQFDFTGHVQPATEKDQTNLATIATLPSKVQGSLPALRGRFGTVAFYDGSHIASYNPANDSVVQLVVPAAQPISLDADESGRHLLWVDANHDLWTWSGDDPVKIGTGFTSAAW